jgi:hypothetical protein
LPREQADLLIKALELAKTRTADSDQAFLSDGCNDGCCEEECSEEPWSEDDHNGSREPSGRQQQQADALVEVSRAYLAGGESKRSATADHYQVTVHVDERALRGEPEGKPGSE